MKIRELKEKDADRMILWMHSDETKNIFIKDFANYTREDIINFKNIDYDNLNAELAISFIKDAQGTGAAMFAMNEILKIGFNDLELKKVYLNVLCTNLRAINFYKKCGFIQEGCFINHVKKDNAFIDLLWFAIDKDMFNKGD